MEKVFKHIVANIFFEKYCPQIKSIKHKLRGFNGRGNPTEFSPEEKRQIKAGLKKLFDDLKKMDI